MWVRDVVPLEDLLSYRGMFYLICGVFDPVE